jgi:hypothetical protein
VLEELPALDALEKLSLGEEVVVPAVRLPGTARARGRRDGELEVGTPFEQRLDKRALSSPRRAGDDEELGPVAQRRSSPTSSAR